MSKKNEALKLALEYRPTMNKEVLHSWATEMKNAAQGALAEQPAQQEPVYLVWLRAHCAWMHTDKESFDKISDDERWMLYTSPPAQRTWVGLTDDFLQQSDYHLLHRFIETTEDDEGYDIGKEAVKRLAELGVVQSHGFGKYSVTMFGYWVHERYLEQNPSLPLKTNADRAIEAKLKEKNT